MKRTIILIIGIAAIVVATVFIDKSPNMETTNTVVVMETNKGSITIELFDDKAPKTVENFIKLAGEGFYDGTRFHRVIETFMIQGGDPQSRDLDSSHLWGTGGPGYKFEDEIHEENNNLLGTISMANSGPNTNGSQFFINTQDNSGLDPKHTVFGKVVEGMESVFAIAGTPVDGADRPIDEVVISSVKIK
ncbi:MAG: peptidyl-prolyl cis-trans isomerase B (cyclophilin B) [Candidatus Paceibacteria bacterium]|jgi:peptidyl-prolyl cis-trans isomerase B (cyclophilin B)